MRHHFRTRGPCIFMLRWVLHMVQPVLWHRGILHTVFHWILPTTLGVIILALQMCTLRPREVKLFAQSNTAAM